MSMRIRRLIVRAHRAAKVDAGQSEDKSTGLLIRIGLQGAIETW